MACAGVPDTGQALRVTLESIEQQGQGESVSLQISLKNDNDSSVAVAALRYRVWINGTEIATGITRQAVDLPARTEAMFDVTVPGKLLPVSSGQPQLEYMLSGAVRLDDGGREVPFTHKGVLSWQDVDAR